MMKNEESKSKSCILEMILLNCKIIIVFLNAVNLGYGNHFE